MHSAFALDITVTDQAGLSAALSNGSYDKIILGADIALTQLLTVNMASQNVVIDGNGLYGLTVANTVTNGLAVSSGTGTLTLQNMSKIDSANYYSMVYLTGGSTAVNVVYDNIGYLGSSQLIFMGGNGGVTNSVMTFGNILSDVVVNDRGQEIGEVNKLRYTGRFHVTHLGGAVSFQNASGASNTSTMDFLSGADVKIDRTGSTANLTNTGTNAFAYDFADNSAFELIANQNVFSGTNTNRGLKIGSYDALTGFGAGAKIILRARATGGGIISGNAIDNATTNTAGINNGATGTTDVIYNLATGSILQATGSGIVATKNAGNTSGIYISSGAAINAATAGISASHAGSGKILLENKAAGNITSATGISATNTGTATIDVANKGTINSTTAGIALSSSSTQTVNVDNSGGIINATAGTGINVLTNALLNMVGGTINITNAANGLTFAGTGNHALADLIINLGGTGLAFSKAAATNLTLSHVTLNTANRTALDTLAGLTFASSANGRNTINVTGTGTGIATTNTALSALNPAALDINVSGAGTGINASGGGVDFSGANLNINVTNSGGTGLLITDGTAITTIGANTHINAAGATAINFTGTGAKTLNNNGTLNGAVIFAGIADKTINNNGILNGTLTTGSGNDSLVLGSTSQSNGSIDLGDGSNNVTIQNGAQVSSITTGTGNDTFNINNMTVGSTYLGSLNAGSGTNTLNFNTSTDALAASTSLQGFANINLTGSHITLVSGTNVGSGVINIDGGSELLFGSTFNSALNASLGHVAGGDGSAIVNNGANVTLNQANAFAGDWKINQGGTLTASNSNQLGATTIALNGTLNLNGVATSNNALTGNGLLNIDNANNTFNFGGTTGTAFAGTVDMRNSNFSLNGNNTGALRNASFIASTGASVGVDSGNQVIGNFALNGGTVGFVNGSLMSTGTLAVTSNSTVRVDPTITTGGNLLDQDTGSSSRLISSVNTLLAGELAQLTLRDTLGNSIGTDTAVNVTQNANTVAQAIYNYALSGVGGGLSLTSVLTKLALISGQTLTLTSQGALDASRLLTAQLMGSGNVAVGADNTEITLSNIANDYIGTTTVNGGILNLGSNNALGQTSALITAAGTNTNINGHSQTVGALTNAGTVTLGSGGVLNSGLLTNTSTVNLTGGTLNLSAGGTSTATGGLTGAGTLNVNGGNLAISGANSGLAGQTNIASGAAATLNGAGTLGNSAVNVLGDLTLNGANAALANVLSGNGAINTNAAVTLTGNNSFSGAHHIGAAGALTVGQASNLGSAAATVSLDTATSRLVLNALSGSIANALSGVSGSTIAVVNGSNTTLTGNNSGFSGQYALAGNSTLTVASTTNLGAASNIALAGAQDILALSGFNGTFGNTVSGNGKLQVTNGSNATLTSSNGVGSAVTVDIANATLNLADIALFNNALTGNGLLNIDTTNNAFNFGGTTGTAFAGTVDMKNSQFALNGNNTRALTNAKLVASAGTAMVVGSGNQAIGDLTLHGATTTFNTGSLITTDTLAVTDNSTVRVDPTLSTGGNLLDQDTGNSSQLINSSNTLSAGELAKLALEDTTGNGLGSGTTQNVIQGGNTVAQALYNYALSGDGGGLSVTSMLTQLALASGQSLTLTSQGALNADNTLVAKLTAAGNLIIGADNAEITLSNIANDYIGTTTVNGGILNLGSNNALGQTSALITAAGTNTNINGHSQTVGALTNAGTVTLGSGGVLNSGLLTNTSTVNLTGGTLNLSAGGTSTATGGLTGAGTLNVNGGNLAISAANSGLAGQTNIASGAAATLNGAGTLGNSAVNVLGDLTLNGANAALANVLSGNGAINTNAAVTLTGNNSFSGAHHIGAAGALTVGQASNLGSAAATVSLDTATSRLVLNALSGSIANALSGVSGSTIAVVNGSNTTLTGNNSGFSGQYALAGNSTLTVASTANLGAASNIALAGAQDILALSGFNGTFGNTVSGNGKLQVTNGSNATLTSSNGVGSAVTVDIANATLNLADIALFNNALTGNGLLNIDTTNNAFNFGGTTGTAFAGTVDMKNSQFALNGNNTRALTNAKLVASAGTAMVVGSGNQAIGDLTLHGATTTFNTGSLITTDTLAVTDNSTVRVDPTLSTGGNLLDQDTGNSSQLINSSNTLSAGELAKLALEDTTGNGLGSGTTQNVIQGGNTVAQALYNYALSGDGGGLSVTSMLTQLALASGQSLTLTSQGALNADNTLVAKLTAAGNLIIGADNAEITLSNIANDYTGTTTVNGGILNLGSNNALGQTSALITAAGTNTNINGHSQTVGALTNAGTVTLGSGGVLNSGLLTNTSTVNLTGGTLNLSAGGTSTATGGLTGAGTLNVNGGNLAISAANSGLAGQTNIASGAAATLNGAGTLGNSAVNVLGDLTLNGANAALANVLSGNGAINTNAAVTLTGNNSFSGAHHIGAAGALTVGQASNLGSAAATVSLDTATSRLVLNALSGSIANALSGVSGSTIAVVNGSNTTLTGNNSGFSGQYALAGNSTLTVASTANLGAASNIALAGAQDILALSGFNGTFGNTVSGNGKLQVTNGSNATLTSSNGVGSAVTVDIANATLNLADIALFNNALTGNGTLNVAKNDASTAFDFGSSVGGAFSGIVNLTNSTFALNAINSAALANATLKLSANNVTTVGTTDRTLHGVDLSGGTLIFDGAAPQSQASGVVTVTDLALNSGTVSVTGTSSWDNSNPVVAPNLSILDQDRGGVMLELINANNVTGDADNLDLMINGTSVTSGSQGVLSTIQQGGSTVANATHNYGLTSNNGAGGNGLYVNYSLSALELLTDGANGLLLATDSNVSSNKELNALVSGVGGLQVDASNGALTLANGNNTYRGETRVNAGELILGANNAFGQTALLNVLGGASANINGHSQTVGALTNAGTVTLGSGGVLNSGLLTNTSTVNLTGGTLNLSAGGTSTATGGLTGAGTLNVNGGNLAISGANSGLAGQTNIASGAAATLNGAGTLGNSAVNVLGSLTLNGANAALANVLSGNGAINTNAAVTLTGNNSFSGAHHIGAAGALTVGQASNLGSAAATVSLDTATSRLVLNALSGSIANALSGVSGSTIAVVNGSNTALTGNNSGFSGQYALAGNSTLTVASTANLGAASNIALAGAQDILALSGFNGTFGNTVSGNGKLQVTNGSNATLTSSNGVGSAVTVDIANAALNLADIALFNNALTGNGTLNVAKNDASTAFDFGSSVGGAFSGIVNLTNSTFALNAINSAALANATLKLSANNVTTVGTTDRTLHGVDLSGGTLIFDGAAPQSQASGVVTVTDLALNSGTVSVTGTSSWNNSNPVVAPNLSILDQDRGNIMLELINANNVTGNANDLDLMINGTSVTSGSQGVLSTIQQGGSTVANATHNYGLTSNNGAGGNGLYVNYSLSALELLTDGANGLLLATDSNVSSNKELNALVSGVGGLQVDASNGALTLANGNNTYRGETRVNAGELILGANNAFGQTALLNVLGGASANINGHSQTVGALTNAGTVTLGSGGVLNSGLLTNTSTVNLTGGTLNLSAGGTSTATGGLTGAGTLNVNGGNLAISGANSGLAGQTNIASGAAATLNGAGTLGNSAVNVLGDLNLNGANAALANVLSGNGAINTNAAVTLTGNNSFSGAHHIGAAGALTVGQASNLGSAAATVSLDTATSRLVLNALSGSIANALSGVSGSTIAVVNGSNTALTGNNSGFSGQYALAGNSTLTVASTANLGAASNIALAGAQDILALSGFNGTFGNTVSGNGKLQVTNGSNATLTSSNGVGSAVTVDIANAALNLADIALFNNALTGNGTLNVAKNDASTAFDFGSSVGGAFSGIVNLQNTTFNLDGLNTSALTNSTLKLSNGSFASVADGVQNIGALSMNGGTILFNNLVDNSGVISSEGTIAANNINTTGGGTVRVNLPANVTPSLAGLSVMELDEGEIIVTLGTGTATGTGHELTLTDENGDPISSIFYQNIYNTGGSAPAALGSFNYGMTTGNNYDGLYVNYGLKALELLSTGNDALILTAILANNGKQSNDLSAQVTGSGDLAFDSANDGSTASLSNSTNSYTGATWVRSGNLRLDADSALGQTSLLAMSNLTNVDLNGTQQTVGELATETGSTLNFNGGKLSVTGGGQVDGALVGNGELALTAGTLSVTQGNSGFTGSTDIASGATAHLYQVQGLGSGNINNNGLLNLDSSAGVLSNVLTGSSGNVLLTNNSNIQLAGNNSGYSGSFSTDAGTVLTANNAQNLGASSVVNSGELVLDTASQWSLTNTISGSGTLVKRGSGTVIVEGSTVSAGLTTIEQGLLQLGSSAVTSTLLLDEVPSTGSLVMTVASNVVNLASNVLVTATGSLGGYGQVTGNVENRGNLIMPNALTGGDFGTFTIDGNYTGVNGTVVFNTILAGDSSVTDRLLITGDTAGQSYVTVNNIGGNGARTSEGIKIINVGGNSAGEFTLNGRAVAGAYEYFLYQGGVSSPTDGDWYLRTQADDRRPEPASYTANLAAANNMFVTSLADRAGETLYTDVFTGEQKTTSLWLRNEGSHNRSRDNSGELKTQDNRYVVQLGGDVAQWSRNSQDLWRVGMMAGYANSSSSTVAQGTGYRSTGSVNGYSVGMYGTWFADGEDKAGAYVDSWLQYSWFNNQVNGQDLAAEKYDSKGFTASVESGYAFKVGENANSSYFIQPKAQITWMGVKADSHTETNGTVVTGDGNNNIQTRLGVKAFISPQLGADKAKGPVFKPFVETNWIHNTKDFGTTLDGMTVKQAGAANVAEVKLGVEGQMNNKLNLWGNVGQQVGNNGYSETSVMLGIKYNF
nr:autotransporter outer membrane beta-barrel domain-containing protein [Yersinia aldovae]